MEYTGVQGWHSGESARLPTMWPGFDSRTRHHMLAEFVLVLDPAQRVFLRVFRFSSLNKNWHTAYSSWLLAVLRGHAWTVQWLPAAPIYAGATLSCCVLAVLARAISETVIIIIIIQMSKRFLESFSLLTLKRHSILWSGNLSWIV